MWFLFGTEYTERSLSENSQVDYEALDDLITSNWLWISLFIALEIALSRMPLGS